MTDEELAEKRQQLRGIRHEVEVELWRRFVLKHPEFKDISWDGLMPMRYRCTEEDNPGDVCMNANDDGPCVFCRMSDWRE